MPNARRDQIHLILRQLQQRRPAAVSAGQDYALDENIHLLESLLSVNRYLDWIAHRMPQLQPDRLLELNELLPEWDEPIHRKLLQIERVRWPAFIRPLVDRLTDEIGSASGPMLVMDLGAGAMEIERQVISRLLKAGTKGPVTFIGIDESPAAQQHARDNLATLGDAVQLMDMELPRALELSRQPARFRVIFCRASAQSIASSAAGSVDLLFHSFLRHHLTVAEQEQLDITTARIALKVIEYDGYRSGAHLIPASMLTWHDPAFLAATLFSHVRFATKGRLKDRHNGSLKFFRNGFYLAATRGFIAPWA